MKLAASHIAWNPAEEAAALKLLQETGFTGLEIAPGRVAGQTPYQNPEALQAYAVRAKEEYGLSLCSMQSIWYGQQGSMFGPERPFLLEYTKAAIRFAKAGGIANLVFGCPKNRNLPAGVKPAEALPFFAALGEYAAAQGACLALEANPALYGTNFMNRTEDALAMAKQVGSAGCRVNLDFGTLVANGEAPEMLRGQIGAINHVHISEPNLLPIERRAEHRALATLLREEGYSGYVSVEMREAPLSVLQGVLTYISEVFA